MLNLSRDFHQHKYFINLKKNPTILHPPRPVDSRLENKVWGVPLTLSSFRYFDFQNVDSVFKSWFSLRWKPLVRFWIQLFSNVRTVDSHYENQLDNWVLLHEPFNIGLNNCCEDTLFGVLNLEGSRSSSCDLVNLQKKWDCGAKFLIKTKTIKNLLWNFFLWIYSKFSNLCNTCLNQCCA
jgi:hypothetical protein